MRMDERTHLHSLNLRWRRHTVGTAPTTTGGGLHLLDRLEPTILPTGLLGHVRHHAVLAKEVLDFAHACAATLCDALDTPGEAGWLAVLAPFHEHGAIGIEFGGGHAICDVDHALHTEGAFLVRTL